MNRDLISREAALKIIEEYCPDDDGSCAKADADMREMLDEIEDLPAVEAVEVVRCKDCARAMPLPESRKPYFADDIMVCALGRGDLSHGQSVIWPDDFCSDGLRKDDEAK